MLIALAGVGLAAFLYLGARREIAWLTYLLDFGWLRRAAELKWIRSIADQPACVAIQRGADQIGIGWLTGLVGLLLLVAIGILLAPFLVGYYLSPFKLSHGKFYIDEIYNYAIVKPLEFLAEAFYGIDRFLVDGLVNSCGHLPVRIGAMLRRLQGGLIPFYGLAMVVGVLALVVVRMLWSPT
jgi:NADH-quinone oxidoreductase subunit L